MLGARPPPRRRARGRGEGEEGRLAASLWPWKIECTPRPSPPGASITTARSGTSDYSRPLSRLTGHGDEATMRSGAMILAGMLTLTATLGLVPGARADEAPDLGLETTPPRLSLTDGQVSFWRPGAPDWTQAQVNTPLAPGDALSTGSPGTLEIQIGARAFVRAWGTRSSRSARRSRTSSSSRCRRGARSSTFARSIRATRWRSTRPTPRSRSSSRGTTAWT